MLKRNYNITDDFNGKQVQQLLKYYGYSRAAITSLKHGDGLKLNGEHIRTIDILKKGDILTVQTEDKTDIIPNPLLDISVVYEDEDIIVFDKPPFMAVHPSLKHYDDTLANYFTALCPDFTFRSINRLDRNTSGAVVVAKNQLTASRLSGNPKHHPKKLYYAVVGGDISKEYGCAGEIIAPIARVSESIINREVRLDGQYAHTVFKVIKSSEKMSFLEISLVTGRTHQIRVHFSHIGYPLVGDDLYGGDTTSLDRQALHCGSVTFLDSDNCVKKAEAPFPEDMQKIIDMI